MYIAFWSYFVIYCAYSSGVMLQRLADRIMIQLYPMALSISVVWMVKKLGLKCKVAKVVYRKLFQLSDM